MDLKKRIAAAAAVVIMLVLVLHLGSQEMAAERRNIFDNKESLHIWYTDEALTDYLSSMAVKFNEEYDVRVIPVFESGLELLERINEASLYTDSCPDLFIASNDNMGKAYLTGLASEITNPDMIVSLDNFPEAAIQAVTYDRKLLGYPYYYETSALLYNMTYLEALAKDGLESEWNKDAAEEAEMTTETEAAGEAASVSANDMGVSEEELKALAEEKIPELIPADFDALLAFANSYNAPENVEAVFKWDVADIFFNYFFVGNYMNVGGFYGDNPQDINIYNLDAIKALQLYQDLSQFFAIEADKVEYASVIQEFMEGKLVMTTATTDIIAKLEAAKANGEFNYEYGIAEIPNLNGEMESRSLSVTSTIYVNGYSKQKEMANKFAAFLVQDHAAELYAKTGKISANKNVSYDNPNIAMFMKEYEHSVPMPKLMSTSNFWVQMEIVFAQIWNGDDVSRSLQKLSEQIMTQVTGSPYTEEYITPPVEEVDENIDYADDDVEGEIPVGGEE